MGFVITYNFFEKKNASSFDFDKDNVKEKTIKVGNKDDEISRSQLALVIFKLLSRRDILVSDIKLVEFVKKEIKVKNSAKGIVIGNQIYSFDDSLRQEGSILIEDLDETGSPISTTAKNAVSPPPKPKPQAVAPSPSLTPIKQEYFWPIGDKAKLLAPQYKRIGVTVGALYSVYSVKNHSYLIKNDRGEMITVPEIEFIASKPTGDLLGGSEDLLGGDTNSEVELSFPGEVKTDMVNLRPSN